MSHPRSTAILLALAVAAVLWSLTGSAPRGVPTIVFVSRQPLEEPGAIPGLGPHHAHVAPGGRLMMRSTAGAIRSLVAEGTFHDVCDPAISPSGHWIAFAATTHRDSSWRLWRVHADGSELTPITRSDRALDLRALDLPASLERREPAPYPGQPRFGGTGAIGVAPATVVTPRPEEARK